LTSLSYVVIVDEPDVILDHQHSTGCAARGSRSTSRSTGAAQRHARLQDMLSFARRVRGRGVSRFPDPDAQGQLTIEMVLAEGIDVHASSALAAVKACLPATHRLLTPAAVQRALSQAP
jgi:hypothetical protein